jgi:hypothetical protein
MVPLGMLGEEPRIGCRVVEDGVDHHAQIKLVRSIDQSDEILERPVFRVDGAIVGDSVGGSQRPFRLSAPMGWMGISQMASAPMALMRGKSAVTAVKEPSGE